MSSKSAKKANTQAAAAAPAAAASVSGRKHRAPEPAAAAHSDDDADFHDLPKETQPKKKQKKGSAAAAAHVPVLDPEAAAASAAQAAAAQTKKNAAAAASVAAAAASATRKNGGSKLAKVPVVGGAGADDEDMDSGDERDGSDDEGKAVVKTLTKTQAKEARVWDRPAVSATEILPDLHARTPSHTQITAAPTTTGSAAASAALLQPLAAVPSALTAPISKSNPSTRKVIIVLVKASLETVKTKKGYELISADSHKFVLQKLKKNPSEYRPDILHQCLLTLLDSPLNKAGMLQVFVQTEKNVLIEIHSSIRIPRTFKRFAGLMVQLLHKLKIRSSDSSDMLLKVIRNPVTDHLPIGALKIGTSTLGDLVDIRELASNVIGANPTAPVVFCVGSHASGPADVNWTDKSIAISKYPLSASVALGRIMNAFEGIWGVL